VIERAYTQDLWSFGFWAGFQWDFLDDFTLEAGARYNWERKHFDIQENDMTVGQSQFTESSQSETWQAPTGLVSLTYRFGDTASVYWKYSRGFKAGHFNSNSADEPPAKSETIDSFETGMRGAWLDGRIGLRGAFFYYKYNNYQVFAVEDNPGAPPVLEIINANDAQVYGLELDTDVRPLEGWIPDVADDLVLSARFGWLESEYLDFSDTVLRSRGTSQIPVNIDFTGNPLINSPRFKVSGSASWPFELGYWGTITPRYDFSWSDDIYFNAAKGRGLPDTAGDARLPVLAVGQEAFVLHNLTLAYRTPDGTIEVSGWVRNLLDERYKTYAFDASQFSKIVINFVGQPRTVGTDISIRW
jgi:iron complex outermembrane receptor protein